MEGERSRDGQGNHKCYVKTTRLDTKLFEKLPCGLETRHSVCACVCVLATPGCDTYQKLQQLRL